MGLPVERDEFEAADYQRFAQCLRDNLAALKLLLARPGFGAGQASLGAELEMYIVDRDGHAAPINERLIASCHDDQLQPELNRFNLEYNLTPVTAAGSPFSALGAEATRALETLNLAAARHDTRVLPIGILPTLRWRDLSPGAMTDIPRYRALAKGLLALRGEPFSIAIDGAEPLSLRTPGVALEGANTSFQVHWRVEPDRFCDIFNAVQLVTPLAVAIGANSPSLLGHLLWDETRIALFKQSVDYRHPGDSEWRPPSRVPFGFGWVRSGALELFAQSCALFPPLLPITGGEESLERVRQGAIARLDELRMQHGTVWSWNRVIYDPAAGGHLRIEMRALPAGPTTQDMLANSALLIGTAQTLSHRMSELLPALPYHYAEYNFYRAAKSGLDTHLVWPRPGQTGLTEFPVKGIIREILPMARDGLGELGVLDREITRVLAPIAERLESEMTGARWQREMLVRLSGKSDRPQACAGLLENYIREQQSGRTVANWSNQP